MQLHSRPRTPLRATLDLVSELVDARRGPIRSLRKVAPQGDDPAFMHVHADAVPMRRLPGRPETMLAGGSALSWDQACCKAVGEAVERASVMDWEPAVRIASAAEIDPAIDVDRFDAFHASQRAMAGFPYPKLTADSRIGWVDAWSLTRSAPTFVPATLAHRFYQPRTAADHFDECPVSGYACGNTLEEALLGALCEVAERDALMLCWLQQLAVPSLDLSSLPSQTMRDALSRFARSPVRLYCSELTTDAGIPTVLVMMASAAPGWPAAAVATASDMSHERAVVKALGELSNGAALVRVHRAAGTPMPRTPREIRTPEDHGLFYAAPLALRHLDLILRPRRCVRAPEVDPAAAAGDVLASLQEAVRRLAARGLEVLAVELTPPGIAALGLHVVKAIVPGMLPIDFGQMPRHLGVPRLYGAPSRMGYAGTAVEPGALNRAPHPFP
jgi:ribosomal protein S12 methylthiotransferase accessory factor